MVLSGSKIPDLVWDTLDTSPQWPEAKFLFSLSLAFIIKAVN